jgi:imidazolonepropionase-like amidohydrolase
MKRSVVCAVLVLAGPAPVALAQQQAEPPRVHALTNARIVVAPGRVIERGTVVVRDGRIAAVGAQVPVPPDAVPLDLSGRTVYPGLIDAATTVGVPSVARPPAAGPPGTGAAARASTEPPPELRPFQAAADVFAPSDADRAALRAAGITTIGVAFDGGIFPGQTAAASTAADGPLVLRSPVSLQVAFGRRRGGYPSTLMGAIAYIRQAFYDAGHELRVADAFERAPATAPRPSYDPAHRALAPALRGAMPVWFVASTERDMARVIELAADVNVRDWAILGGQEGWRATERLRAAGRPVLVSLDWPQPSQITGRAFELNVRPIEGPDEAGAAADSAAARAARGNSAALARAGVPIALTGYGLSGPAQFRERLLATVEAGLAPDDALRALTVTPARLLGLEGALGTIEPGRLANLVIVEGDLFARDGRIREVFVEGRRYEIRDAPRPARAAAGPGTATAAGEWTGSLEMAGATMPFLLRLTERDGQVSGELSSEMGAVALSGERSGADVILRGTATPPGMTAVAISITGTITNDELRGTISAAGQAAAPFTARRRSPGLEGGGR